MTTPLSKPSRTILRGPQIEGDPALARPAGNAFDRVRGMNPENLPNDQRLPGQQTVIDGRGSLNKKRVNPQRIS